MEAFVANLIRDVLWCALKNDHYGNLLKETPFWWTLKERNGYPEEIKIMANTEGMKFLTNKEGTI